MEKRGVVAIHVKGRGVGVEHMQRRKGKNHQKKDALTANL